KEFELESAPNSQLAKLGNFWQFDCLPDQYKVGPAWDFCGGSLLIVRLNSGTLFRRYSFLIRPSRNLQKVEIPIGSISVQDGDHCSKSKDGMALDQRN